MLALHIFDLQLICTELDIAASAMAVVRMTRAARAVTVTRTVDLALNNDTVVTVVSVDKNGE